VADQRQTPEEVIWGALHAATVLPMSLSYEATLVVRALEQAGYKIVDTRTQEATS
jgi:hypothetical protein